MSFPPPADESALSGLPESADLTTIRRIDLEANAVQGESLDSDRELTSPGADDSELDALGIEDSENEELDSEDVAPIRFGADIPLVGAAVAPNEFAIARGIESDQPLIGPLVVAASGFEAVTPQVFARIGVHESETRVVTIRNASRRAANQILAAHRAGALPDLVDPLADLAWTTYRLVDPRFRLLPFQQVRVGRILPLLLHQAAVDDLETKPTSNAPQSPPVLFGHCLPVVSYPNTMDSAAADLNLAATGDATRPTESHSRTRLRSAADRALSRIESESMQAYAELRQSHSANVYRSVIHDNRVWIGMIVLASAAATLLVAFAIRRSITPTSVVAQTTKHQAAVVDTLLKEANEPTIVRPASETLPAPSPLSAEVTAPASVARASMASETETMTPSEVVSENTVVHEESTTTPASAVMPSVIPELKPKQGIAEAEKAGPMASVAPTAPNIPSGPDDAISASDEPLMTTGVDQSPSDAVSIPADAVSIPTNEVSITASPAVKLPGDELLDGAMGAATDDSSPEMAAEPNAVAIPWDSEDAQVVAAEIWERTPSAARRFTLASAAELIDQWDFDAELSGFGTVEHAGARSLALRAAWLVEPFPGIVQRIREQGPIRDLVGPDPAATDVSDENDTANSKLTSDDPTYHLELDELRLLISSWKDARGRVVIADDLDQLLHQANVLVDRILVSDQISPIERTDLVSEMTLSTERLTRIARDETVVKESSQLAEALESFPEASELERLESSDEPSGFLGRVRCLKQRQWDTGLEWLAQTSDRAIASCAKAEWELASSGDATPEQWIELAERWVKVAVRLPDREAAAVHLHAIELYGQSKEYAGKREEMVADLPRYLAP